MAFKVDGGAATIKHTQPTHHTHHTQPKASTHHEPHQGQAGKIGEGLMAAAMKAAQLAKLFAANASHGGAKPAVTGQPTDAAYREGAPQRPPIFHDNGFLQNPNNPNDPNPMPTRSPSFGDRFKLLQWKGILEAAEAGQSVSGVPHNNIPDALAAYRHFLYGDGADRTFSYERFVSGDEAGRTTLQNATRDLQLAAENKYAEMVARDPSLRDKPLTFQLTGSSIPVGADPDIEPELAARYPYPRTENWQKAIGAHRIWMSGTVTVTPSATPGGKPQFTMNETLHAEDRYNFNPGSADISTGIFDKENGVFEQTGLAHQYMNYATLERHVSWDKGSLQNGVSTRPDPSRDREPQGNRRARNRT